MRLGVVIPTRNRADLAMLAIRALLAQPVELQILVSDNSTSDDDVNRLAAFCDALSDARLVRLRPPRELSMPAHWDWALREARERFDSTHFTVHYDRKVFRPGQIAPLDAVTQQYPDEVITYASDYFGGDGTRVAIAQPPATGRLYALRTRRFAELFAQGRWLDTAGMPPILSNCVVPVAVLDRIRARFGNYCDSIGPDSCFWFRYSALYDRSLHLDRSLAILHSGHLGNGHKCIFGDVGQFRRPFGDVPWLDAAPIPGLYLGLNLLYHEYELVRRETGDRLPPIDMPGYLADLASFLPFLPDPAERAEMLSALRDHGFTGPEPVPAQGWRRNWRLRQRLVMIAAKFFGRAPRDLTNFEVRTTAEAIALTMRYPRPTVSSTDHLAAADPRELAAT